MKTNGTLKTIIFALLIALTVSGCAISSGVRISKTKNEKRLNLRFSNAKAASIFYQSFFENDDKTKPSKKIDAYIKLDLGFENQVSENVKLNDAFRAADKDKNGVVSEEEANAYVQSLSKK
jgi:Ca2+-binding EF-hand superfamily protein